jgi:hypothetical protein
MNALRDQNHVTTKLGVLFSDGTTLIPLAVNETTGALLINNSDTLQVPVTEEALRDENFVHVLLGVNSVDGTTIPVYVDSEGKILIAT